MSVISPLPFTHSRVYLAVGLMSTVMLSACGGGGAKSTTPSQQLALEGSNITLSDSGSVTAPLPADVASSAAEKAAQPLQWFTATKSDLQKKRRIGVNLSPITDWSRSSEFIDLVKQARGFGHPARPWDTSVTIPIGSDGWPTTDFAIILFSSQATNITQSQTFTVTFKGTATVNLIASSNGMVLRNPVVTGSGSDRTTTYELYIPAGSDQLILSFTNTGGSVKDLQVLRPGYTADELKTRYFTREYLAHLAPYSTLRFMDWLSTNLMPEGDWSKRNTPSNLRTPYVAAGQRPGVPWEYVIAMSKESGADIWINIPPAADLNYYTQLATKLRDELPADRKIYVEYGNEMWNYGFTQRAYLRDTAIPAEIAGGNTLLKAKVDLYGADGAVPYLVAERVARISQAFRAVFGDAAMMDRVRPVFAWQGTAHNDVAGMLSYAAQATPGRTVSELVYGIAIAPYFSLGSNQTVDGLNVTQVLDSLATDVSNQHTFFNYEGHAYVARKNGIKLLAYEGGPDTFGGGSLAAKAQAGREPRMNTLCQSSLNKWAEGGGSLFMWFYSGAMTWQTTSGTWSLGETLSEANTSQKAECLKTIADQAFPQTVSRHAVPTDFDAGEVAGEYNTSRYSLHRNWYQNGQSRDFVVSSTSRACYRLAATGAFNLPVTFDVSVEGVVKFRSSTLPGSGYNNFVKTDMGLLCLEPGVQTVSLKLNNNGTADGALQRLYLSATQ